MSPVTAYVSTGRIRRNVRRLAELAAPAALMPVIKADAYGHGAVKVAELLVDEGVDMVAVARIEEAVDLREAGVDIDILVLGAPLPNEWAAYEKYRLDAVIPSMQHAEELLRQESTRPTISVHVKIDTGMGRIGLPSDTMSAVMNLLRSAKCVQVAGIMTHLAKASDQTDAGRAFTRRQLTLFRQAIAQVDPPPVLHVANSTAVITQLTESINRTNMLARVGLAAFGLGETPALTEKAGLETAMRLTARITQVKTVSAGTPISYGGTWTTPTRCLIATVGAGYADGYPRLLSNRASVCINDRRYPVVGNICMDMFMVNLGEPTRVPRSIQRGDEVVLFGPGGPTPYEIAAWAETIPYEICSRIGARVPKKYVTEFENNVNI